MRLKSPCFYTTVQAFIQQNKGTGGIFHRLYVLYIRKIVGICAVDQLVGENFVAAFVPEFLLYIGHNTFRCVDHGAFCPMVITSRRGVTNGISRRPRCIFCFCKKNAASCKILRLAIIVQRQLAIHGGHHFLFCHFKISVHPSVPLRWMYSCMSSLVKTSSILSSWAPGAWSAAHLIQSKTLCLR